MVPIRALARNHIDKNKLSREKHKVIITFFKYFKIVKFTLECFKTIHSSHKANVQ